MKKINPLYFFLLLIAIGVLGMWFGEIWPNLFFWAPALDMGILRAYIVMMGPSIQGSDDLSPEYRKAQIWSWTSLALFAVYLFIMYWGDLANPMHIALQCVNIMLMGAEYTFGQWQANQENSTSIAENLKKAMDELSRYRLDSEDNKHQIDGLKAEVAERNREIVRLSKFAKLVNREFAEPVQLTNTHKIIRCPECLELVPFGNAANEVRHCGKVVYSRELNGEEVELETV